MLKREDLEMADWEWLEDGAMDDGAGIYGADSGYLLLRNEANPDAERIGTLAAAAPKLALACLEAHRYIAHPLANDNKTHAHALKTLRAALATAGVEVE